MSTLKAKGTTMHPRCRHIGVCWDLLEWFQLFRTSQNPGQIHLHIRCHQPAGDSGHDWTACLTLVWRLEMEWTNQCNYIGENEKSDSCLASHEKSRSFIWRLLWHAIQPGSKYKSKSISNFFEKKIKFFGFHVVVLVKTFPLTYQLLMKDWYWRSQGDFFLGIQKLDVQTEFNFVNFELFKKNFTFLGLHGVVLVKTILLMYQLLM